MGSVTPWREGRAQHRDLLLGHHQLGVTWPEQNLLFLGTQWAGKRKEPLKLQLQWLFP